MPTEDPSLEDFAAFAAQAGLALAPDELARMRDGYVQLQGLLARLPPALPMFDEPAVVFVPPGKAVR